MNALKSLALAALVLSAGASQAAFQEPEDLGSIQTVKSNRFEITKIEYQMIAPSCPVGAVCAMVAHNPIPHTVLTISMQHSCLGHLMGDVAFSARQLPNISHLNLFVQATEFVHKDTIRVLCRPAPVSTFQVTVPGRFYKNNVKIHNFDLTQPQTR